MINAKVNEREWELAGDCVEACTSPPVCPYYWKSSAPTDLHDGKDQCEGVFTFSIRHGHHGAVNLSGLTVGFGFNTALGGPASKEPWKTILYIDERADSAQARSLEEIFRKCWSLAGEVLKVKPAYITFTRGQVGSSSPPAFRHMIEFRGFYVLRAEPIVTSAGAPRYISGISNGIIYVGRSTENRFHDDDLPRGRWDRPGMSNTYFEFSIDSQHLQWVP
jgi:hypothetical protein